MTVDNKNKEFRLFNNGKEIGKVHLNPKFIKGLTKFLPSAIVLSIGLSGCNVPVKTEPVVIQEGSVAEGLSGVGIIGTTPLPQPTPVQESTYEEDLSLSNTNLFKFVDDNGEEKTITRAEVEDHFYNVIDNVQTRYDFIMAFNEKLNNGLRQEHKEIDFSEYDEKFTFFKNTYDEYHEGHQQEARLQDEYIRFLEGDLINIINATKLDRYTPEAVTIDKWQKKTIPILERKYSIDYIVPEDTTLSNIVSSYADDFDESKEIFNKIVNNPANNIQNPDMIYAGSMLELPNVSVVDAMNVFDYKFQPYSDYPEGFTNKDELEQRYQWIMSKNIDEIHVLNGDIQSEEVKAGLYNQIEMIKKEYALYNEEKIDFTEMWEDLKQLCDQYTSLTGDAFTITFQPQQEQEQIQRSL